eukprot:scaffold35866_cov124-Isochrysis_galbana.AAC.1
MPHAVATGVKKADRKVAITYRVRSTAWQPTSSSQRGVEASVPSTLTRATSTPAAGSSRADSSIRTPRRQPQAPRGRGPCALGSTLAHSDSQAACAFVADVYLQEYSAEVKTPLRQSTT